MQLVVRWIGLIVLIAACYCRLHARMILPSSMSWSGDFATSEYGELLSGFADVADVFMLLGGLSFILSFSRLFEPSRWAGSVIAKDASEGKEKLYSFRLTEGK